MSYDSYVYLVTGYGVLKMAKRTKKILCLASQNETEIPRTKNEMNIRAKQSNSLRVTLNDKEKHGNTVTPEKKKMIVDWLHTCPSTQNNLENELNKENTVMDKTSIVKSQEKWYLSYPFIPSPAICDTQVSIKESTDSIRKKIIDESECFGLKNNTKPLKKIKILSNQLISGGSFRRTDVNSTVTSRGVNKNLPAEIDIESSNCTEHAVNKINPPYIELNNHDITILPNFPQSSGEIKSDSSDYVPPTEITMGTPEFNDYDDDSFADPDYCPSSSENEDSINSVKKLTSPDRVISIAPSIIFQEYTFPEVHIGDNITKNLPDRLDEPECTPNVITTPLQNYEPEVENVGRLNYKDKKDHCIFCEKDVSHFARHMSTWHGSEFDVQRILSMKTNSKEKKQAWSILRKKGNFIKNRSSSKLRPVKRINSNRKSLVDDFLPCSHCFGFYKKKSLFRHTKHCSENPTLGQKGIRQASQSNGQTALLLNSFIKHDELLKKELFPRMRADEINLIVKKDFLICYYGYSYLKGRRSKGNLDFVRQNMRRLAKLLKFARLEEPDIKELIDVLRPTHFHIIIKAVNEMAQYNPETEVYESPTLAMNFGTLIKKCCDLAYVHLLQKLNSNEQRKELKILKTLIESQWANEVSAQAATNLNAKKWNQKELLPLTSDLKILSEYLKTKSEQEYSKLKLNEKDQSAYTILKEIIYCQIILLNRRRPAEVAQIKTQTFKSINLESQGETEFENCLTETEKILLKSYSRIVIRGKRGRGVPVLLSPNMRMHFEYLLEVRNNFVHDNDYVFHTTGGKTFIDGTKTLYKYAQKCGIQRPHTISATRLRKHLATVTQLLQFSDKDLEQLSKFMGHTLKTHCNIYRLSDNIYQTAKVSKLLLLMTEGRAEQFQGKNIDDININLDPISEEVDVLDVVQENVCDHTDETLSLNLENISKLDADEDTISSEKKEKNVFKKIGKRKHPNDTIVKDKRVSWTNNQKVIISRYFADHIKKKVSPKRYEVETLMRSYPEVFEDKKWSSIKAIVYNIYTGKLKVPVEV